MKLSPSVLPYYLAGMNPLVDAFLQIAPVEPAGVTALAAVTQPHTFSKGYLLESLPSVRDRFYFIEQGLTRTFYWKGPKDITDWISTEGTFAVSLISFINRMPDRRMIEVLEPSLLYSVGYAEVEALCGRFHSIEHVIRRLLSFGLVQLQNKFDEIHFCTARQRYENLLQTQPSILQRVPLGMVASFLGMAPETLSRIRAQRD